MPSSTVDLRRPGWKKSAPQPRQLVFRHGRRQMAKSTETRLSDSPPPIGPGQEQLFSSYVPGVQAGQYRIDATQTITAPDNAPLTVPSSHLFNAIAPRFALPDNAIDSFYPPQGHADRAEVLPHIVFNDPTLPWERPASAVTSVKDYAKNRVPWLVVLLFTQDELRLDSQSLSTVFANPSLGTSPVQSETLSVNMKVADIPLLQGTASSVLYDSVTDGANTTADVVLLQSSLFNALFTNYDSTGTPVSPQANAWVQPYRFLAHVRHVHLDGTAAAALTDDDDHAYSVVLGPRTGPLDISQPTSVIAHLVNIEGVENMSFPVQQQYVVMTSLHSWAYTCLPPSSMDVHDAFVQLGTSLSPLRPTLTPADQTALKAGGEVGAWVCNRLNDGFSLMRYRLQTGEVSSAFVRGPFTPTIVEFPVETPPWPSSSTTGTKLQILDAQLNIMDLTYSAAWCLGKTLALADQTFTSALARVRTQIFSMAMNLAQVAVIKSKASALSVPSPYQTREDVLKSIADTVKKVRALPTSGLLEKNPQSLLDRWYHPSRCPPIDFGYKGADIDPIIDQYLGPAALIIASTTDGGGSSATPPTPYNEYNTPYSPDWAVVLKWVMDRYFLANVPPHYLITDPSHLPLESLRIFYIDPAWVSAMIDGGLSLANHMDHDDDLLRDAIKAAINKYLTTPIIPPGGYVPPIPTYGFLLRSALVTKFPDMIVDVAGSGSSAASDASTANSPPVLLRHEVIGPDTMIGMLLEPPTAPNFTSLYLRQPPHQQFFTGGTLITPSVAQMAYKRVYSITNPDDKFKGDTIDYILKRGDVGNLNGVNFIWSTSSSTVSDVRLLNVENYAGNVQTQLVAAYNNTTWYNETYATAALMGFELTEPSWQLKVDLPTTQAPLRKLPRTLPLPKKTRNIVKKKLEPLISPKVPSARLPPFGHRPRVPSLTKPPPPPHRRLPRTLNPIPAHKQQQLQRDQLGDAPGWTFNLYSLTKTAGLGQLYTLSGRQDLIFTANLANQTGQDFHIISLTFSLPLKWTSQDHDPPLMDNYDGAGATMLSNLRFNALYGFAEDGKTFDVTLVPRAGQILASQVQDASFMLAGVVLKAVTQREAVSVAITLVYGDVAPLGASIDLVLLPAPPTPTPTPSPQTSSDDDSGGDDD